MLGHHADIVKNFCQILYTFYPPQKTLFSKLFEPLIGIEPMTSILPISCSTNWATTAYYSFLPTKTATTAYCYCILVYFHPFCKNKPSPRSDLGLVINKLPVDNIFHNILFQIYLARNLFQIRFDMPPYAHDFLFHTCIFYVKVLVD